MPNTLAYAVLALWPLIALWLFARLPPGRALLWTIVGGYMALPPVAAFDPPMVPTLDKFTIANLSALLGCLIHVRGRALILPRSPLVLLLMGAFVASPLATTATNGDPLFIGPTVLQGQRLYDAISMIMGQMLFVLPFFLARNLLTTPEAHRDILRVFMLAGLIYSIPMLIEIRLSPQINTWIYGFFQHSFAQMARGNGFRPIVFMPHGLWVALFAMTATVAAAGLARGAQTGERPRLLAALAYLFVVLVLCKSLAALVYALMLVPLVLLAPRRIVLWAAFAFAAIALSYPLLRGGGLVPVEALLDWARGIDPERAQSLEFRFVNEAMLLERASDRPWFGWGGWGRNHVYDLATGQSISVTDGRWIIVIGVFGWLGYLAEFGLLTAPIFMLVLRSRAADVPVAVGATAILLGINLIDMLPNATLIPITWVMAGAVLGYVERDVRATTTETRPGKDRLCRKPLQTIL